MDRKKGLNKRGQVTIFIIIAIVIVAGAVIIYTFYPQIKTSLGGQETNPPSYIQSCIEGDLRDAVNKVETQGGSIVPELYAPYYDGENEYQIEYLCYTDEFYRPCVVQQPMLKQHIELELKNAINDAVDSCFTSMKESYERRGYSVDIKKGDKKIELLPKRVVSTFNYSFSITKGEDVEKYDSFIVLLDNNLYELTSIANSIVDWETTYGDAETSVYMAYYHDLKVEKNLRGSGDKIYIITDRNTGNKFQFAIKSQVWPEGYAVPTI